MGAERKAEAVGALFDYAAAHTDFDYRDVQRDLGWDRGRFFGIARALRLLFRDDQINLICEPTGPRSPYRYRLVGDVDGARVWVGQRSRDMYSRLETVESVAGSLVHATDGRSLDGRKARKVERTMAYLRQELADLDGHGGTPE